MPFSQDWKDDPERVAAVKEQGRAYRGGEIAIISKPPDQAFRANKEFADAWRASTKEEPVPAVSDMFSAPSSKFDTVPADGKASNPKDLIGSDKLPLHLWPALASAMGSLALLDGMLIYGRTNWREAGVRASIYNDACRRHLDKWMEGESHDKRSKLPHLAHALACIAILIDAEGAGELVDDRMFNGAGACDALEELAKLVPMIRANHAGHAEPKHYTIADNKDSIHA